MESRILDVLKLCFLSMSDSAIEVEFMLVDDLLNTFLKKDLKLLTDVDLLGIVLFGIEPKDVIDLEKSCDLSVLGEGLGIFGVGPNFLDSEGTLVVLGFGLVVATGFCGEFFDIGVGGSSPKTSNMDIVCLGVFSAPIRAILEVDLASVVR